MAFTTKIWYDAPNPLTPLSAAAMNDLEARIAAAATQADAFNLQPAVRCYNSATLAGTPNNAQFTLTFDTNRYDSDSQHYTSAANLTGTVQKTAASAAIVGTGTLFTSQLSVGQVIDIPGTATERRVVTSITDDTHLTVNSTLANSASGQTAPRVNSAIVARTAGVYGIVANARWAANATGRRQVRLMLNGATLIGSEVDMAVSDGGVTDLICHTQYKLAQWDYVEAQTFQLSGGTLDLTVGANTAPEFAMFRVAAG